MGGTTVGGHHGFESWASKLIVPPKGGGAAGSDWPSIVDAALGEPGSPVTCWAAAGKTGTQLAANTARQARIFNLSAPGLTAGRSTSEEKASHASAVFATTVTPGGKQLAFIASPINSECA